MSESAVPSLDELLRHTRWIEELAHRLVRDPAAADDLAQSAWIVALRDRESPRENLRGWLGRVVRNLARERHRREAQRGDIERAGARREALPSALELLARAEAERGLVAMVTRLDEPHRTTLLLRYFEGLAPEEIARREGVPLATITHRITRAHARLRERLGEREGSANWLAGIAPILQRDPSAASLRKSDGGSHPESDPGAELGRSILKIVPTALVSCIVLVAIAVYALQREKDGPREPALAAHDGGSIVKPDESTPVRSLAEPDAKLRQAAAESTTVVATAPTAAPASAPATNARGVRIHGRVIRPNGEPAAKRKVRLLDMQPAIGKGSGEQYVACDERGDFDAPGLEAGVWSISTWPDKDELTAIGIAFEGSLGGMSYLVERTIELADGASSELVLGAPPERPIHVKGRVLQDGKPIEIAAVQWLPAGDGIYDLKKNARMLDGETYEVTLEKPGRYYATAILDGARPEWSIDVPDERELALDLVAEPNLIEGRVLDAAGKPVAGASVELSVRSGCRAPMLLASLGLMQATDSEGRFRFVCLRDALYVVHASGGKIAGSEAPAGAASSTAVRARPAKDSVPVELVVEPGVRLPLRVVDVAGKERNANVFVFDAQGEPLDPCSGKVGGSAGARTLVPLAPGRYSAIAAAGNRWSAVREFELRAGEEPKAIELVLEPAASILIDARALPATLIELVDEGGRRFGSLIDTTRFNRAVEHAWDGDAPLLRVPRGNYEVRAMGLDGIAAQSKAALVAEQTVKVVLVR